jgi:DNA mismatch endonuclease (patch repair protein)
MDIVAPEQRSSLMSRIRGKDTGPEIKVRRLAHALGFRFRLHRRDLPGSPDLVFPSHRKVIFVHGCYWHRHEGCRYAYSPKSNTRFWQSKFEANVARDRRAASALEELGWNVLVIWECETRNADTLRVRLIEFLKIKKKGADEHGR